MLSVECWTLNVSPPSGQRIRIRNKNQGFTLIEVLLAVGIFAIVLFAINTVFFSALKLERATSQAVDARVPLNQAFAILRRDLQGAVQPMTNSTLLPRNFVAGFTTVFVGLGAGASVFGQFIQTYKYELSMVAGVVIILFGLHFLGLPWLHTWGSGRFAGLTRDAEHVVDHVVEALRPPTRLRLTS